MSTSLGVGLFAEDSDSDVEDERDASDPNKVIVNSQKKAKGRPKLTPEENKHRYQKALDELKVKEEQQAWHKWTYLYMSIIHIQNPKTACVMVLEQPSSSSPSSS